MTIDNMVFEIFAGWVERWGIGEAENRLRHMFVASLRSVNFGPDDDGQHIDDCANEFVGRYRDEYRQRLGTVRLP